jgi:hypothetical protein
MFYAAGALVIILNYREASVSVIAVHFYPGRKGTQGRAASFSPDHLAFSTRDRSAAAARSRPGLSTQPMDDLFFIVRRCLESLGFSIQEVRLLCNSMYIS